MRILNRHNLNAWPENAVYIGRGTPLGNPNVLGEHGDRDEVCDLYDNRLAYRIQQGDPVILTALLGLKADSQLVCSCAPARCHGQGIEAAWKRLQEAGVPKRTPSMAYAGIGSRKTPADVQDRLSEAARRLARKGYTLRSGGAAGADTAFEQGAGGMKEIFLPWTGFAGRESPYQPPSREAMDVAAAVHPAWQRLSDNAKLLMARNSYQVLGEDLRNPVDFVVCWTSDGAEFEEQRSSATGGTGQAIALASRWRIPVFNLARDDAGGRLRDFLKERR